MAADSLAGLVSDYNAVEDRFSADDGNTALSLAGWQAATGQDAHSVRLADRTALDALFVNRAAGDYHLAAGSAAIDRGTAAGAPAVDFEGQARPSGAGYDIGADEFFVPANTPPTISAVGPVTVFMNGKSAPIAFRVGDAETPAAALVVTVSSSNPALFPPSGLVLGGSGADRTITLVPARRKFGTAVITLTVTDALGVSTSTSFVVTVLRSGK